MEIVRSFTVHEGFRLHYTASGADGAPVKTETPPAFVFDPPLDGSILTAITGGDPLGSDPTEIVLKSTDGATTGHFETTLTGTARASLDGEPERDVAAVVHLSITITPEEAAAAEIDEGDIFELPAAAVGGGTINPVPVSQPAGQVVGLQGAGAIGEAQVPGPGGTLAAGPGPIVTPAGTVAPESGNPASAAVNVQPGVQVKGPDVAE